MSADVLLSRETPEGDRLAFGPPATLVPRSTPPELSIPESSCPFFGYVDQSTRLAQLAERRAPAAVGIWGPGGAGKTALLVRAAVSAQAARPDGGVLLSVRGTAAEDIIALLCDAVFEVSDPRSRPSRAACSAALATRRSIVALDDVGSAADLAVVQAALAGSLLLFTTARPWNVAGVEWVGLHGLTSQGVSLLRSAAGGDVSDDLAAAVVHALEGNPSRIVRAARLGLPLGTILASCRSAEAFDELSLVRAREVLSLRDQHALAAAATFGEAALGPGEPPATLIELGFLERSPLGWAVPDGLRERAAELERDAGALASALLGAPAGGERVLPGARTLLAAAPGLLRAIERDGVPASRAGRAFVTLLDRHGLWAASSAIYEALRGLSRRLEDPATWAWAMHQLGVRAACAGDIVGARALFAGALAARQFNADEPGCAVTVANLTLLSGTAASVASESTGPPNPQLPALVARPVAEPEVVLLPPERGRGRVWHSPAPRKPAPIVSPLIVVVSLCVTCIVLGTVFWLVASQSVEPPLASAVGSALPRVARPAGVAVAAPASVALSSREAPVVRAIPPAKALSSVRTAPAARAIPAASAILAATPGGEMRVSPQPLLALRPLPTAAASRGEAQRVAGRTRVSILSLLPSSIAPHERATLCVSAVDADRLDVSGGVGALPPRRTTCRAVSPAATTTYVARASNDAWRATRTVTLRVTPARFP